MESKTITGSAPMPWFNGIDPDWGNVSKDVIIYTFNALKPQVKGLGSVLITGTAGKLKNYEYRGFFLRDK